MTTADVRALKIKTSLAQQMAQPGGRTLADVERRANERLARHKGEAMQAVAATITELERVCGERPTGAEAEVYRLASQLLDLAGFFDTGPLYDAGYSLAETADRMTASGAWTWPSVGVHVRALRLILAAGCKADATSAQLLAGLRAVALKARGGE